MDRRQKQYMRPLPRTGTMAFQQPCAIPIYFTKDQNLVEWQAVALKPKGGKKLQRFEICNPGDQHSTIVVMAAPINGKTGDTHHVSVHVAGLVCAPYNPKNPISRKRVHEDANIDGDDNISYGTHISSTHIIMKRSKTSPGTSSAGENFVNGDYPMNMNSDLFETIADIVFDMEATKVNTGYTLNYTNPTSNFGKIRFNHAVSILGLTLDLQDTRTATNADIFNASSDVLSKLVDVIKKYTTAVVDEHKRIDALKSNTNTPRNQIIIDASKSVEEHKQTIQALFLANSELREYFTTFGNAEKKAIQELNDKHAQEISNYSEKVEVFSERVKVLEVELQKEKEKATEHTTVLQQVTADNDALQEKATEHTTVLQQLTVDNEALQTRLGTVSDELQNAHKKRNRRTKSGSGVVESTYSGSKREGTKEYNPETNVNPASFVKFIQQNGISIDDIVPEGAITMIIDNLTLVKIIEGIQITDEKNTKFTSDRLEEVNNKLLNICLETPGFMNEVAKTAFRSRYEKRQLSVKTTVALKSTEVRAQVWTVDEQMHFVIIESSDS